MPTLPKELRTQLARTTLAAREAAERACRAALENLAVHEKDYRAHMSVEQRVLRNRLRARGRALGDTRDERSGVQEIAHLTEHAAYEQWHRLLFTRFLAENHLLHTDPENGSVPVTLAECEELAPDLRARDGFDLACRFAARTLPGVFRTDDPVLHLRLALNDEVELRKLLDSLPSEVFTATDSLGWTYQFWQEKRKDEINASGKKISADELPAVTQLFTEDYMVDFLLDNTLGAWHAGKALAAQPRAAESVGSEEELRQSVSLPGCPWKYLRFIREESGRWRPAAGIFEGWPKSARDLTCLDPCMGSGHFVVAMFERLLALRLAEEKLDAKATVFAVLRENLFGLEIDPRCTQIAAFNLALTAWRRVGFCSIPVLHLACSGLAPNAREAEWVGLAGDSDKLRRGMERLYRLFEHAPVLGSLINPRATDGDLLEAGFHELQPLLQKALAQEAGEHTAQDVSTKALANAEMAVTARGLAKTAEILAGQFTLIATNVPYLGRGKQDERLKAFCEHNHPEAMAELATSFTERGLSFCQEHGSLAVVTPQTWLFLGTYERLRNTLLSNHTWHVVALLGPNAFRDMNWWAATTGLAVVSRHSPTANVSFAGFETSGVKDPAEKGAFLASGVLVTPSGDNEVSQDGFSAMRVSGPVQLLQSDQLENPDSRIVVAQVARGDRLERYANSYEGLTTGDIDQFVAKFWETGVIFPWKPYIQNATATGFFSGRTDVIRWGNAGEIVAGSPTSYIKGRDAWGYMGIRVTQMRSLPVTLYTGEIFGKSAATILPREEADILAIWCFLSSPEFHPAVRSIDQKVNVTVATLIKVPFDLSHWQKVAAEKYPKGFPKPFSTDPTQWLFSGHPDGADHPLHVAVARLVGYRWPRQSGSSFRDCPALGPDGLEKFADDDGVVCLPPLNREQPAASRLRTLLAAALGTFDERALLAAAGKKGSKSTTLEDWLRDEFFEQHCDLFHQRPFVWHVWDGRKDGFHALVHYHRLDHTLLQKLTYSYLGDWIRLQEEDAKAEKPGADARLGAARVLQAELAKILEGEAPYDLFVRWKPLAKQAIGWHPDLNDGVRLNIRPFLTAQDVGKKGAGVLRAKPGIKWDKDRGKEPQRDKAEYPWFWCEAEPGTDPKPGRDFTGHRWNDVHLSLATKKSMR